MEMQHYGSFEKQPVEGRNSFTNVQVNFKPQDRFEHQLVSMQMNRLMERKEDREKHFCLTTSFSLEARMKSVPLSSPPGPLQQEQSQPFIFHAFSSHGPLFKQGI